MLELPRVTLCTFGSTDIEGMQKALDYSSKDIKFGAVKLIQHECNGIDEWNYNIVHHLGDYIDTDFCLLVHPDGFVVHPESWRDEWLKYDYIGAPWPLPQDDFSYRDINWNLVRVGNSVSLRSKKLLTLPKRLPEKMKMEWRPYFSYTNEDGFICCHNRHVYEHCGCTFAPIEVAKWFSREIEIPENKEVEKPFCFHRNGGRNSVYPNFES